MLQRECFFFLRILIHLKWITRSTEVETIYYTLLFHSKYAAKRSLRPACISLHWHTNTTTPSFKLRASNLEVPSIDLQDGAASVVGHCSANTDGDYVVEPGIGRTPRHVFEAEVQLAGGRGGALRPHVDVRAVLGHEAVPRIWVEGARRCVKNAPVGSQVDDCACERR